MAGHVASSLSQKGVREVGAVPKNAPVVKYKKPSYRRKVESILREYPVLKASIENERQLEREGLGNLFPSCTPLYDELVSRGFSEYQSTTERYAIIRATKIVRLQQIERALAVLNLDERFLIEKRYLDQSPADDMIVCDELGWSKRTYYRIKRRALDKLAMALNFI
jgi:ArpU family phage transcriptional regulator